jgi:hypothetical protein
MTSQDALVGRVLRADRCAGSVYPNGLHLWVNGYGRNACQKCGMTGAQYDAIVRHETKASEATP